MSKRQNAGLGVVSTRFVVSGDTMAYLTGVQSTGQSAKGSTLARVLVIDDDPNVGEVIKRLLSDRGHEVILSYNGDDGYALLEAEEFTMAIVDIFLPGTSGLEIIQAVSANYPGVKIIAMTAFGAQDDIDLKGFAERYGAIGTIEKPFDNDVLLQSVSQALEATS